MQANINIWDIVIFQTRQFFSAEANLSWLRSQLPQRLEAQFLVLLAPKWTIINEFYDAVYHNMIRFDKFSNSGRRRFSKRSQTCVASSSASRKRDGAILGSIRIFMKRNSRSDGRSLSLKTSFSDNWNTWTRTQSKMSHRILSFRGPTLRGPAHFAKSQSAKWVSGSAHTRVFAQVARSGQIGTPTLARAKSGFAFAQMPDRPIWPRSLAGKSKIGLVWSWTEETLQDNLHLTTSPSCHRRYFLSNWIVPI